MARLLLAAAVATDMKFLSASSVSCSSSSWSTSDIAADVAADEPLGLMQIHKIDISGKGLGQRPQIVARDEDGDPEEEEEEEPEDGNCSTHVSVYMGKSYSYADNVTSFTWNVSCNGNSHEIKHITFSNDTWGESDTDGFIQASNSWQIGKDGNFKWPGPDAKQIYGLKYRYGIDCNVDPEPLTVVLRGKYAPCDGQYKIKTRTQTIFCPSIVPCTPEICEETSECKIWGDPHIIGFDSQALEMSVLAVPNADDALLDLMSKSQDTMDGIYWLVKSERVQLQGRYAKLDYPGSKLNGTYMVGLAMSGPALEDNIIEVHPQNGQVFWNGEPILKTDASQEFMHDNFVALRAFESQDVNINKADQMVTSVEAQIGTCIKLLVNRHSKHLNMRLSLPRDAAGVGPVGGQCGNFNGDAADDASDFISARSGGLQIEDEEEILFGKHTKQ